MKKNITCSLLVCSIVGLFSTGCYTHRTETVEVRHEPAHVVVSSEPPVPRQEVVGVAPSAEHVWVGGYWTFRHERWVWVPGHWEMRPRPGVAWVPGHWTKTINGWVWTPGHWS